MTQMKKVSASLLTTIESCNKKGYFEQLNLSYTKGKSYKLSIQLKEFFKKLNFNTASEVSIMLDLEEILEDCLFFSKQNKKEEIAVLTEHIIRFVNYKRLHPTPILNRNIIDVVSVKNHDITVTADFVFQNDNYIEIVKMKRKEPKLSYSGRKPETKPQNSLDLFLLSELGKKLYPGKNIKASLYHLKSKDDKSGTLSPEFEIKKGKNIVSHFFDDTTVEELSNRIDTILSLNLTMDSEKTCDTSLCGFCQFAKLCNYEHTAKTLVEVKDIKKSGKVTFTESQYEAIFFRKGIARINAGAGSGKTTVLSLRVAELIQEGVKPEDILLITYTNKGAQEMREKISYWLKETDTKDVSNRMEILTFNAWGDKVIQNEFTILGFEIPPRLAEKVERYDIIFEVLDENEKMDGFNYKDPLLSFPNAKGVVVQMSEYFNSIKSQYVLDATTCSEKLSLPPSIANTVFNLYKQYEVKMKERNLLDYQDQINLLLDLVENHFEAISKYSYQHIMIDEFQDSDSIQFDIMSALIDSDKFESLMVVGDDSQSIFGFRYTSQEIILNFHKYFEEVKDIYFVENFRSTPQIIETANLLNDLNTNKIDKRLVSKAEPGVMPRLLSFDAPDDEYRGIADIVEDYTKKGTSPENIAIIARTKNELLAIEEYLKDKNIPTVVDVSEKLISNSNIQIMISFADFFENIDLEFNLLEYLYVFQKDTIKSMSPNDIQKFVQMFKEELLDGYEDLISEEEKIKYFFDTVNQIADKDPVVAKFIEELKEKKFRTSGELFSFLRKLVLYQDEKAIVKDEIRYQAVILTTAHSSKGKEFDIVINTIDNFKNEKSMSLESIEEERRLLFGVKRSA